MQCAAHQLLSGCHGCLETSERLGVQVFYYCTRFQTSKLCENPLTQNNYCQPKIFCVTVLWKTLPFHTPPGFGS